MKFVDPDVRRTEWKLEGQEGLCYKNKWTNRGMSIVSKKCPKSLRVDSSCNINSIALQNTD